MLVHHFLHHESMCCRSGLQVDHIVCLCTSSYISTKQSHHSKNPIPARCMFGTSVLVPITSIQECLRMTTRFTHLFAERKEPVSIFQEILFERRGTTIHFLYLGCYRLRTQMYFRNTIDDRFYEDSIFFHHSTYLVLVSKHIIDFLSIWKGNGTDF